MLNTVSGELKAPLTQNCQPKVEKYKNFSVTTPNTYKKSFTEVKKEIENQITARLISDGDKLRYFIFSAMYLGSGYKDGFEAYEHNYSGVILDDNWYAIGSASFERTRQYFCLVDKNNVQTPNAIFRNLTDHIILLIEKWKNKLTNYTTSEESITKFLILNRSVYKERDISVYNTLPANDKKAIQDLVAISIANFRAA